MTVNFGSLGLDVWLEKQCNEMGLKVPSEIQTHCIPRIIQGEDCIGCAKTGSGKTAAFALPILQKLSEDPYGIFATILTPTRELAIQISEQFEALGRSIGLTSALVIGGLDMVRQGLELAGQPHVVIASPGRLASHLRDTGACSLNRVKFLVLDEADRLLEKSFEEDLKVIFEHLPSKRQTLLFSATLSDTMQQLMTVTSNAPFCYQVQSDEATVSELEQQYVLVPPPVKDCYLAYILQQLGDSKSAIVFTHTCRSCQVLTNVLRKVEFKATGLHSVMSQRERIASLAKFRAGISKILVATDVASRGLDIPLVELVVNFNVPGCHKDYIHRVGRTARAGRGGVSLTIVTQYDIARLQAIEANVGVRMSEFTVDETEALKLLKVVSVVKREVEIRLNETGFGEKRDNNRSKRGEVIARPHQRRNRKASLDIETEVSEAKLGVEANTKEKRKSVLHKKTIGKKHLTLISSLEKKKKKKMKKKTTAVE